MRPASGLGPADPAQQAGQHDHHHRTALPGGARRPRTAAPALVAPGRHRHRLRAARLPLSIVTFVLVVTGLSVGVGTLIIWIGLPLLVLTLLVARGFAAVERRRIPAVLQRDLSSPVYRRARADAGPVRRLVEPL
jgi:hypothetical protein